MDQTVPLWWNNGSPPGAQQLVHTTKNRAAALSRATPNRRAMHFPYQYCGLPGLRPDFQTTPRASQTKRSQNRATAVVIAM